VASLRCSLGKQVIQWDDALPGFGVQTSAKTGRASAYVVQGRIGGRVIRRKVERVDRMSLAQARDEARKILVGFRAAIDPRAKKEAGATLRSVLDGYLKVTNLKPRSVEFYRDTVQRHLNGWLDLPVASITRDMVEKRHRQVAADVEARDRADNAE